MKKAFAILHGIICLVTYSVAQVDTGQIITLLDRKLKSGERSITSVLTDPNLMYLHSLTPFREIIKQNAKPGNLEIVTKEEPGERVSILGSIVDESGKPFENALIYFYQTSDKGWYSDTGVHIRAYEGDHRYARLFGYTKTRDDGTFGFKTIKPKGYPQSDLAAHIHIQLWNQQGNALHAAGELQFEDDPRMTPDRKKRSLSEGFLISPNSGTSDEAAYRYRIVASSY